MKRNNGCVNNSGKFNYTTIVSIQPFMSHRIKYIYSILPRNYETIVEKNEKLAYNALRQLLL